MLENCKTEKFGVSRVLLDVEERWELINAKKEPHGASDMFKILHGLQPSPPPF